MFAVEVRTPMGRKSKQDAAEKATTHIRVFPDIADMVGWIVRVEKKDQQGGAAQLLDPMIRSQITARYNKYLPIIEKLKAAEAEVRRIEEEETARVRKPPRRSE